VQDGVDRLRADDVELILLFFRDRGFDVADCIYAVQDLFGKEFSEAKGLVIHSRTWAKEYDSSSELREAARDALRQLATSNSPDLPGIVFEDEDQ